MKLADGSDLWNSMSFCGDVAFGFSMRLGILGGTFDPVHYGHLLMAETCRQNLELDELRLIPAGEPPHKPDVVITDGHARADMLELAVSGYPEFVIDRRELRRSGPSFTVDTLSELTAELPGCELFLILGADSLRDLPTWKQPATITSLATIVAVNRPGTVMPSRQDLVEWLGKDLAEPIRMLQMPGTDISATELRDRIRSGKGVRFLTPRAVEAYIREHSIYA